MHSSTSLSTWVKAKEIKWHKITCAVLQLQMLQKRNNYEGFNKTGVSQQWEALHLTLQFSLVSVCFH